MNKIRNIIVAILSFFLVFSLTSAKEKTMYTDFIDTIVERSDYYQPINNGILDSLVENEDYTLFITVHYNTDYNYYGISLLIYKNSDNKLELTVQNNNLSQIVEVNHHGTIYNVKAYEEEVTTFTFKVDNVLESYSIETLTFNDFKTIATSGNKTTSDFPESTLLDEGFLDLDLDIILKVIVFIAIIGSIFIVGLVVALILILKKGKTNIRHDSLVNSQPVNQYDKPIDATFEDSDNEELIDLDMDDPNYLEKLYELRINNKIDEETLASEFRKYRQYKGKDNEDKSK